MFSRGQHMRALHAVPDFSAAGGSGGWKWPQGQMLRGERETAGSSRWLEVALWLLPAERMHRSGCFRDRVSHHNLG